MNTKLTIKKVIAAILAIAGLVICCAPPAGAQQNLLVQTTITAAIPVPSTSGAVTGPPSATPGVYGLVQLASATGITGYTLNPTNTLNVQKLWVLYIDREEIAVIQINGTVVYGLRGYNSTVATSHASGSMVLYGLAAWFYNVDPGAVLSQGGAGAGGASACTVAGQFAFPWVNVRNGAQWACSPTSLTYVPWFNNPLNPAYSVDFGTAASVAGAQPILGPLFRISGTNAITSFTVPVGMNNTLVGGSQFCIIPTGAFTATATNNIAAASTAVVGKTLCYTWDAATAKFNPSY